MKTQKRWHAGLMCALFVAFAGSAWAQQVHNPKGAEALFRDGRQALKQGDYAKACQLFGKSYSLDPAPGTLMNIAECEERQGQLLVALQHFRQTAESLGPDDERLPIARARITALDQRLPHLVIRVQGLSEQTIIVLDDSGRVAAQLLEQPIPLMPGSHQVVVYEGALSLKKSIDLVEGQSGLLAFDMAALKEDARKQQYLTEFEQRQESEKVRAQIDAQVETSRKVVEQAQSDAARQYKGAHGTGIALSGGLGAGVPGIIFTSIGLIGVGQVYSCKATVEQHCVGNLCDTEGMNAARSGKTWSILAPVFLAIGVPTTALGVYFVVKGVKARSAASLQLTPTGPAAAFTGTF